MITISIDPIAFSIGPLVVRWYGIMTALAVVAVLAIVFRETRRLGISPDFVFNIFLWAIVGGFIGGRLVHIIDNWSYYVADPGQIIGSAGLALYGAIFGVVLAVCIYIWIKRKPFSSVVGIADAVAVGAPLAQAIGRIGCIINGCCYGIIAPNLPWAVFYSNPYSYAPLGIPMHPTQIYFLLWNLIVFAVIWRLRGRIKPQGSLFLLYLCLYAAGDFGLRFFRYTDTSYLFGLHQGQIISLVILMVAVPWLVIRMRRFSSGVTSPQPIDLEKFDSKQNDRD